MALERGFSLLLEGNSSKLGGATSGAGAQRSPRGFPPTCIFSPQSHHLSLFCLLFQGSVEDLCVLFWLTSLLSFLGVRGGN